MVGGHQRHRTSAEIASAIQTATIEQHLAKPQVIVSGGTQTRTSRVITLGLGHVQHCRHGRFGQGVYGQGLRQSVSFVGGNHKVGVFHAQGFDQFFFEQTAQRFFAHRLEYPAEQVGGQAVFPSTARLPLQRRFGKSFDLLLWCERDPQRGYVGRKQTGLLVSAFHAGGSREFSISQPRGMAQQVVHGDLTNSIHGGT